MDFQDLLARIEIIIDKPSTCDEDKIALKESCALIKKAITREEIKHNIEFLAAVLGIAAFILAVSS